MNKYKYTYVHKSVSNDDAFFLRVGGLTQHLGLNLACYFNSELINGFDFQHRGCTVERVGCSHGYTPDHTSDDSLCTELTVGFNVPIGTLLHSGLPGQHMHGC